LFCLKNLKIKILEAPNSAFCNNKSNQKNHKQFWPACWYNSNAYVNKN